MIRTLTISMLLAACGGKHAESAAPEKHEMHEEHMPPQLAKFHDTLAPRWHAETGPQRMKDTCAAMPDFTAGVTVIAEAAPPTTADSAKWTNTAADLAAAVSKLDETCKANDATGFESAFKNVHESFHAMLAASGAQQGEEEHAM